MTTPPAPLQRLLVGTYPTSGGPGSGEGIWSVDLDPRTGELSGAHQLVEVASPSFLALHPDGTTVVAVSETEQGRVSTFSLSGDGLVLTSSASTGGADPCHLVVDERDVWVANYSSGSLAALTLTESGTLGGALATFAHSGSGPVRERQRGPHAHYVQAVGERHLWVSDLGTDEVRRYRRTATPGVLVADGLALALPPGTGPRHVALGDDGTAFVVGELDSRVHVVRVEQDGSATHLGSVPACDTPSPEAGSFPSHLALSADGSRLYVGVRGPDVLATFAVERDDEGQPVLRHLADSPLGVVWPRHLAVLTAHAADPTLSGRPAQADDLVVVAGQTSGGVTVLRVDHESGQAEPVSSVDIPAPACILPV
ncbi:3-carboxymuconate cyclase [Sanguibacter keddieii DSM 10542]|uniref:3-carboxymuconate cyclase n=1 Tax=Sanguibacter keddieii (strain ATCC 51767 / DSM 10542 / NCFB 3025 / ST-74) TaxID=446469 RepID=D1BD86_SANKS|nr:lactonase family protein [Sanguibacter keddieii]ACZ23090.1 3-carboxymuconate cyclase [Sanguibacter keddieii DSM 10542]